MKHNTKITIILISMFLITQIIGIFVVKAYFSGIDLPYGFQPPAELEQDTSFVSIIFAFCISILLFFLLTKIKAENFIRIWFLVVTTVAIALTLNIFLLKININYYPAIIALIIGFPLAYFKVFKRNILIHNLTELLIYPGIAAVFIPLLNPLGALILLLLISLYDIWAVWHSEIMQKMAKYQINTLKFFTGFFIPYASDKDKKKIRLIKDRFKGKSEEFLEKKLKESNVKVSLAILGGGDIIFPIITAGVFYKAYGSIIPAIMISIAATFALLYLFIFAEKKKFYPAMPFISIGIYIGIILYWTMLFLHIL